MRVLIVGGGGREHALAWACRRDRQDVELIVAPGNGGTGAIAENVAVDVTDAKAVAQLAVEREVDLVVIGPDAAAAAGVADACAAAGVAVFGPNAAAARIESSKSFAKALMRETGIPTARWVAGGRADKARLRAFIAETEGACVVKADGLALGKGVAVSSTVDEAEHALAACVDEGRFGAAGTRVVIEQRLSGPEASVFALSDGRNLRMLPPARDHKRRLDGDLGPNTGGMGAVAPLMELDSEAVVDEARRTVMQPCIDGLALRGTPFVGCLYAGLIVTASGIRVLEFNARFGDPEAQVVLPLLDEPLLDHLVASAHGRLEPGVARSKDGVSVGVVAATSGYPGEIRTGDRIDGLDMLDADVHCFHAGTRLDADGTLRTSGGRVLSVVAIDRDAAAARTRVYANLRRVSFDGIAFRSDIAAPAPATAVPTA